MATSIRRRGAPKITSANEPAAAPTVSSSRLRTGTSTDDRTRAIITKAMNTHPVRLHDFVSHGLAVTSSAVSMPRYVLDGN